MVNFRKLAYWLISEFVERFSLWGELSRNSRNFICCESRQNQEGCEFRWDSISI